MGKCVRFLLGAAASGSGKTTITCALLNAFRRRGLQTVSFKCGPDYLDLLFHAQAMGIPSWNLDPFFTKPPVLNALLKEHCAGMEAAVIEGVMGYFDGLGGTSLTASTCDLARITNTPAVLVLDCRGMSRSAAAMAKGYLEYAQPNQLQGVILNRISPMMYPAVRERVEQECHVRVYGFFPPRPDLVLPSRHLGLIPAGELPGLQNVLQELAEQAEKTLDIEGLLALGGTAPEPCAEPMVLPQPKACAVAPNIAVAQDEAFCFLYRDNLMLLEKFGAQLCFFSPLHDRVLPVCDGLLLPGGYPELYARALSENASMRKNVHSALQNGLPCIAECGGFLYLHDSLTDTEGKTFPMAGVIPARAYPAERLKQFGYVTLTAQSDQLLCPAGAQFPAHEFHYWESSEPGQGFRAVKASGRTWLCGHGTDTLYAGFPHLYWYAKPDIAVRFLDACGAYHQRRESRN